MNLVVSVPVHNDKRGYRWMLTIGINDGFMHIPSRSAGIYDKIIREIGRHGFGVNSVNETIASNIEIVGINTVFPRKRITLVDNIPADPLELIPQNSANT